MGRNRWWRREDREVYYYDTEHSFDSRSLAAQLFDMIQMIKEEGKTEGVVFLCIGTDRSTGDSLGPLIGYKLRGKRVEHAVVVGDLEQPVHAMNLEFFSEMVKRRYPNHVVVAVDASVGNKDHIGCITLGKGSLKPGLGVRKELMAVGDIFLTGIVGGCGSGDPLMLQSIRLSVVMRLADCICDSIFLVEQFWKNATMV